MAAVERCLKKSLILVHSLLPQMAVVEEHVVRKLLLSEMDFDRYLIKKLLLLLLRMTVVEGYLMKNLVFGPLSLSEVVRLNQKE